MKEAILDIVSDKPPAGRLLRINKRKYNVNLIQKTLMYRGVVDDKCYAEKIMTLVLWDAARGRDSHETIISSIGDTDNDIWDRIMTRLQLTIITDDE